MLSRNASISHQAREFQRISLTSVLKRVDLPIVILLSGSSLVQSMYCMFYHHEELIYEARHRILACCNKAQVDSFYIH